MIMNCYNTSKIISIKKISKKQFRYDLSLETDHRYFANGILVHNTDGQNLNITFKDGEVKAARNNATLKEPMTIKEVAEKFEGRGPITDAFVKSMEDVQAAIEKLSQKEIDSIFNNGHNYMSMEIIYPPTKNVVDYGGRCLLQFHGINKFDEKFNKIGQDKEAATKLYELLKKHDALNQKTFEIAGPAVLKIKNSVDAEKALKEITQDLDNLVDGIGYNSTLADYVKERYEKKIVNAATRAGISISKKSEFVSELADRLSQISGRKPTKADLATYAKKEGIDTKTQEYKDFLKAMEDTLDTDNTEILLPIEKLVVKAGTMLIQNLTGFVAADKSASAQKLSKELDEALAELEKNEDSLTPSKLHAFLKNLKKLDQFGRTPTGIEGIVFMWKGQTVKMTANFGPINQLLGLFKFDR